MNKILLVEDGLVIAIHLKLILIKNAFEVVDHLTRGEEVFDTYQKLKPDLLILDIMLEGIMSGIDAAKEIRTVSEVPIIFLSALTDSGTMSEIAKISNSIKLNKPFDEVELLYEIKNRLSQK